MLQKRLDYGFNGYQVPPIPRAARSARVIIHSPDILLLLRFLFWSSIIYVLRLFQRRCIFKRKADDPQMCAFDLLATVAGKLLLDGESSPPLANTSSVKELPIGVKDSFCVAEDKPLEEKSDDREYYERNFLFTELVSEAPNPNVCSNELACTQNDVISGPASGITTSDCSEKVGCGEQLVSDDCKLRLGIFTPSVDVESSGFGLSANCGSEDESRKDNIKMDIANTKNLLIGNKASLCSSGNLEVSDRKPSALVCSVDSVKFPFCKDHTPCGSLPVNRENVKLVTRDDDDNSSEYTEPSTRNKAFKSPPRVGDRRFRKMLASKHCKITPNVKNEERHSAG